MGQYATIGPAGGSPTHRLRKAKRCNSKDFGVHRCRGVHGHEGLHWCYDGGGWLRRWPSVRKMKEAGFGCECIPPGHDRYVHPLDMLSHDFVTQGRVERIDGRLEYA